MVNIPKVQKTPMYGVYPVVIQNYATAKNCGFNLTQWNKMLKDVNPDRVLADIKYELKNNPWEIHTVDYDPTGKIDLGPPITPYQKLDKQLAAEMKRPYQGKPIPDHAKPLQVTSDSYKQIDHPNHDCWFYDPVKNHLYYMAFAHHANLFMKNLGEFPMYIENGWAGDVKSQNIRDYNETGSLKETPRHILPEIVRQWKIHRGYDPDAGAEVTPKENQQKEGAAPEGVLDPVSGWTVYEMTGKGGGNYEDHDAIYVNRMTNAAYIAWKGRHANIQDTWGPESMWGDGFGGDFRGGEQRFGWHYGMPTDEELANIKRIVGEHHGIDLSDAWSGYVASTQKTAAVCPSCNSTDVEKFSTPEDNDDPTYFCFDCTKNFLMKDHDFHYMARSDTAIPTLPDYHPTDEFNNLACPNCGGDNHEQFADDANINGAFVTRCIDCGYNWDDHKPFNWATTGARQHINEYEFDDRDSDETENPFNWQDEDVTWNRNSVLALPAAGQTSNPTATVEPQEEKQLELPMIPLPPDKKIEKPTPTFVHVDEGLWNCELRRGDEKIDMYGEDMNDARKNAYEAWYELHPGEVHYNHDMVIDHIEPDGRTHWKYEPTWLKNYQSNPSSGYNFNKKGLESYYDDNKPPADKKSLWYKWSFSPDGELDIWPVKDGKPSHSDQTGWEGLKKNAQGRVYRTDHGYNVFIWKNRPSDGNIEDADRFALQQRAKEAVTEYIMHQLQGKKLKFSSNGIHEDKIRYFSEFVKTADISEEWPFVYTDDQGIRYVDPVYIEEQNKAHPGAGTSWLNKHHFKLYTPEVEQKFFGDKQHWIPSEFEEDAPSAPSEEPGHFNPNDWTHEKFYYSINEVPQNTIVQSANSGIFWKKLDHNTAMAIWTPPGKTKRKVGEVYYDVNPSNGVYSLQPKDPKKSLPTQLFTPNPELPELKPNIPTEPEEESHFEQTEPLFELGHIETISPPSGTHPNDNGDRPIFYDPASETMYVASQSCHHADLISEYPDLMAAMQADIKLSPKSDKPLIRIHSNGKPDSVAIGLFRKLIKEMDLSPTLLYTDPTSGSGLWQQMKIAKTSTTFTDLKSLENDPRTLEWRYSYDGDRLHIWPVPKRWKGSPSHGEMMGEEGLESHSQGRLYFGVDGEVMAVVWSELHDEAPEVLNKWTERHFGKSIDYIHYQTPPGVPRKDPDLYEELPYDKDKNLKGYRAPYYSPSQKAKKVFDRPKKSLKPSPMYRMKQWMGIGDPTIRDQMMRQGTWEEPNYDLRDAMRDDESLEFRYSFDGGELHVWPVDRKTKTPSHFMQFGTEGYKEHSQGRIYVSTDGKIHVLVWSELHPEVGWELNEWCRKNLGGDIDNFEYIAPIGVSRLDQKNVPSPSALMTQLRGEPIEPLTQSQRRFEYGYSTYNNDYWRDRDREDIKHERMQPKPKATDADWFADDDDIVHNEDGSYWILRSDGIRVLKIPKTGKVAGLAEDMDRRAWPELYSDELTEGYVTGDWEGLVDAEIDPASEEYRYSFDGNKFHIWPVYPRDKPITHWDAHGMKGYQEHSQGRIYLDRSNHIYIMVWSELHGDAKEKITEWCQKELGVTPAHDAWCYMEEPGKSRVPKEDEDEEIKLPEEWHPETKQLSLPIDVSEQKIDNIPLTPEHNSEIFPAKWWNRFLGANITSAEKDLVVWPRNPEFEFDISKSIGARFGFIGGVLYLDSSDHTYIMQYLQEKGIYDWFQMFEEDQLWGYFGYTPKSGRFGGEVIVGLGTDVARQTPSLVPEFKLWIQNVFNVEHIIIDENNFMTNTTDYGASTYGPALKFPDKPVLHQERHGSEEAQVNDKWVFPRKPEFKLDLNQKLQTRFGYIGGVLYFDDEDHTFMMNYLQEHNIFDWFEMYEEDQLWGWLIYDPRSKHIMAKITTDVAKQTPSLVPEFKEKLKAVFKTDSVNVMTNNFRQRSRDYGTSTWGPAMQFEGKPPLPLDRSAHIEKLALDDKWIYPRGGSLKKLDLAHGFSARFGYIGGVLYFDSADHTYIMNYLQEHNIYDWFEMYEQDQLWGWLQYIPENEGWVEVQIGTDVARQTPSLLPELEEKLKITFKVNHVQINTNSFYTNTDDYGNTSWMSGIHFKDKPIIPQERITHMQKEAMDDAMSEFYEVYGRLPSSRDRFDPVQNRWIPHDEENWVDLLSDRQYHDPNTWELIDRGYPDTKGNGGQQQQKKKDTGPHPWDIYQPREDAPHWRYSFSTEGDFKIWEVENGKPNHKTMTGPQGKDENTQGRIYPLNEERTEFEILTWPKRPRDMIDGEAKKEFQQAGKDAATSWIHEHFGKDVSIIYTESNWDNIDHSWMYLSKTAGKPSDSFNLGELVYKWSYDGRDNSFNMWEVDEKGNPSHFDKTNLDFIYLGQGRVYKDKDGLVTNLIWLDRGDKWQQDMGIALVDKTLMKLYGKKADELIFGYEGGAKSLQAGREMRGDPESLHDPREIEDKNWMPVREGATKDEIQKRYDEATNWTGQDTTKEMNLAWDPEAFDEYRKQHQDRGFGKPREQFPHYRWSYDPRDGSLAVWPVEGGYPDHFSMFGSDGYDNCAQGRIYHHPSKNEWEVLIWPERPIKVQWGEHKERLQTQAAARVIDWIHGHIDPDAKTDITRGYHNEMVTNYDSPDYPNPSLPKAPSAFATPKEFEEYWKNRQQHVQKPDAYDILYHLSLGDKVRDIYTNEIFYVVDIDDDEVVGIPEGGPFSGQTHYLHPEDIELA
jgi:hypothetical protein